MSLSITGQLREELEKEIPASLFVEKATIGEEKSATLALGGSKMNRSGLTDNGSTTAAMNSDKEAQNTTNKDEVAKGCTETIVEKLMTTR